MRSSRSEFPAIGELIERLERGRAHYWRRLYLHGLLWSFVAATSTYVGLALLRYFVGALVLTSSVLFLAAVAILILGFVLTVVHAHRATPTVAGMARLADQRFGLEERLSTTLEISQQVPSERLRVILRYALLNDTKHLANCIDPRQLVDVRYPQALRPFLALSVFSLITVLFLPQLSLEQVAPRGDVNNLALIEDGSRETKANIRRAAQLIAQDAEERNDPYLRAVAQGLEALGLQLESETVVPEDAERELNRLLSRLNRVYGSEPEGAMARDAPFMIGKGLAGSNLDPSGAVKGNVESQRAPEKTELGANTAPGQQETVVPSGEQLTLENLLERLEANIKGKLKESDINPLANVDKLPQREYMPPSSEGKSSSDEADPAIQARVEQVREYMELQAQERAAIGELIGAADEAGSSSQAGEGSQPLGTDVGGGAEFSQLEISGEDIKLPFDENARRRIKVDAPPDEQFSNILGSEVARGAWQRDSTEVLVSTESIGFAARNVASRYFLTINQADEDANP